MNEQRHPLTQRWKPWQVVLLFGILQTAITGFGTFFDLVTGVGMFFVYVVAHLNALVVVLPILLYRRFGVGTAVYLPWAISGLFVEYYLEYVLYQHLRSPWGVVGWCAIGLVIGLSADLAFKYLPGTMSERHRSILTAVTMGAVNFLLTTVAVLYFYVPNPAPFSQTFPGVAYWALPWLIVNSGFGGYAAYAISRRV
jgi:uncharacterized BrkB/YihY/UPF0761 family membrane protein